MIKQSISYMLFDQLCKKRGCKFNRVAQVVLEPVSVELVGVVQEDLQDCQVVDLILQNP